MIELILKDLKAKAKFGMLTRFNYTKESDFCNHPLSAEDVLAEIEAVGQFRSPRFVIDDNNRFAYTNLAKWILGDPTMECINPETGMVEQGVLEKGIYLAGATGTGKSWAMDIISYLATAHGIRFSVFGKEERFNIVCNTAQSAVYRFIDNEDPIHSRIHCFNDLGTEMKEAIYMGNRQDVMRDYIEERADTPYQITCFTSNYPINHKFITERYGDRAVSRLRQMCNYLVMKGDDRRR